MRRLASIRTPSTQIAPQARQKAASTPGRVTHAFSLQPPQTCRSLSLNQASMSTLEGPASVNVPPARSMGARSMPMGRSSQLSVRGRRGWLIACQDPKPHRHVSVFLCRSGRESFGDNNAPKPAWPPPLNEGSGAAAALECAVRAVKKKPPLSRGFGGDSRSTASSGLQAPAMLIYGEVCAPAAPACRRRGGRGRVQRSPRDPDPTSAHLRRRAHLLAAVARVRVDGALHRARGQCPAVRLRLPGSTRGGAEDRRRPGDGVRTRSGAECRPLLAGGDSRVLRRRRRAEAAGRPPCRTPRSRASVVRADEHDHDRERVLSVVRHVRAPDVARAGAPDGSQAALGRGLGGRGVPRSRSRARPTSGIPACRTPVGRAHEPRRQGACAR